MRAVELAFILKNGSGLNDLAKTAKEAGYTAVGVEGITKPVTIGDITLVPRLTTKDLAALKRFAGLRAYLIEGADDLRGYPRLRRFAHIVTVTDKALRRLGPKEVEKLSNLGLPVELQLNPLIRAIIRGQWLRGLRALLLAALADRVSLAVSSGGTDPRVIRPVEVKRAFLEVFGLTQSHSFEAVITVPSDVLARVMRS